MTFKEFRALLRLSFTLMKARLTLDDNLAAATIARAERIHAQIEARKAAGIILEDW